MRRLTTVTLLLATGGCNQHLFSPPARVGSGEPQDVLARPTTTGIFTLGAGLKIPLSGEGPCLRPGLPPLSLLTGAQMTILQDRGTKDYYAGAGLAIEARF